MIFKIKTIRIEVKRRVLMWLEVDKPTGFVMKQIMGGEKPKKSRIHLANDDEMEKRSFYFVYLE